MIVGAFLYDNGQTDEGAAFLWFGGPSRAGSLSGLGTPGSPSNADWRTESNQAEAGFGYRVFRTDDVDGDGYGDVAVATREGMARVFRGSPAGLDASASGSVDCLEAGGRRRALCWASNETRTRRDCNCAVDNCPAARTPARPTRNLTASAMPATTAISWQPGHEDGTSTARATSATLSAPNPIPYADRIMTASETLRQLPYRG